MAAGTLSIKHDSAIIIITRVPAMAAGYALRCFPARGNH
jgi:hypothetical protein